jgi:Putative Ig domain/Dockerin type I domain
LQVGDQVNCQNMNGLTPSTWTASVSQVQNWQNLVISQGSNGTYTGGGWCRTVSETSGFAEFYIPSDPIAAPMAPIGVTVGTATAHSLTISFTPDPSSTSTIVQRRLVGSTTWSNAGVATGSSFVDTGLTAATTYEYRLSGSNAKETSGPTITFASATTGSDPNAPTILSGSLPSGVINTVYTFQLSASGGAPPYQWSLAAGTLPSGIILSGTGLIAGSPIQTTSQAGSALQIKVTDSAGASSTKSLSLAVNTAFPIIDSLNYPDGGLGSSNWARINNSELLVATGGSIRSYNNYLAVYINTVAWYGNNQWGQVRIAAVPTSGRAGVGIRMANGSTPWGCVVDATHVCTSKSSLSGSSQTETCATTTVQTGDIVRAEAADNILTCKLNGTTMISGPIDVTGGAPGIYTYSPTGLLKDYSSGELAGPAPSPCDLDGDGVVTSNDVAILRAMVLGTQSCTADLDGDGKCTVVDVQRVIIAASGGACRTGI